MNDLNEFVEVVNLSLHTLENLHPDIEIINDEISSVNDTIEELQRKLTVLIDQKELLMRVKKAKVYNENLCDILSNNN